MEAPIRRWTPVCVTLSSTQHVRTRAYNRILWGRWAIAIHKRYEKSDNQELHFVSVLFG